MDCTSCYHYLFSFVLWLLLYVLHYIMNCISCYRYLFSFVLWTANLDVVFVVLLWIFINYLLLFHAVRGCDELPWYLRDASNAESVCWIGPFCKDLNGVANLDGLLFLQATICCLRSFAMYKKRQSWASESYCLKVLFDFCCFIVHFHGLSLVTYG